MCRKLTESGLCAEMESLEQQLSEENVIDNVSNLDKAPKVKTSEKNKLDWIKMTFIKGLYLRQCEKTLELSWSSHTVVCDSVVQCCRVHLHSSLNSEPQSSS